MKPWVWVRVIVECVEKRTERQEWILQHDLNLGCGKELWCLPEEGGVTHRLRVGQDTAVLRGGVRVVRSIKCMAQANLAHTCRLF